MTRLNKSVKLAIVNKAISDKFKTEYEKAVRAVDVAARDFAVINSQHVQFNSLNLPPEMMSHVNCESSLGLDESIRSDIGFIRTMYTVSFDTVVYAYTGCRYLRDEDLPELKLLRSLVKKIETEYVELFGVISSYNNAKKLLADLPWVKDYLPTESSVCMGLIAADVIAGINAKFGK